MKKDNFNLTKEELRKQKRKSEQRKAFAVLAGVLIGFIIVVGAASFGVYSALKAYNAKKQPPAPEVVEEPVVLDEPEEIKTPEPEPEPEPEIEVSGNSLSDNDIEEELTDEKKLEILDAEIDRYISALTTEQKVAGLFFVTTEQLCNEKDLTVGGSSLDAALRDYPVGGILLTENNFEDKDKLKDLTFSIKSMSPNEIFIGVAETGGENGPFVVKGLEEVEYDDQAAIGESADNSTAYTAGIDMGSRLNEYGFNVEIGPLTDVAGDGSYTASRSFGSDSENVRGMVRNMVRGLEDKSINVCPYFFPGYSDIKSDPAGTRPVSSRSADDIKEKEYPMYRDCINSGVQFVMVSQIAYKSVTNDDTPACFSDKFINDMLRTDLEYDGIVMTDYLNTKSLVMHYKHADMAVMAVKAGADMLFCPGDFKKAYNGVLDAVKSGDISEERIDESLRRIYRVKYKNLVDYGV